MFLKISYVVIIYIYSRRQYSDSMSQFLLGRLGWSPTLGLREPLPYGYRLILNNFSVVSRSEDSERPLDGRPHVFSLGIPPQREFGTTSQRSQSRPTLAKDDPWQPVVYDVLGSLSLRKQTSLPRNLFDVRSPQVTNSYVFGTSFTRDRPRVLEWAVVPRHLGPYVPQV